MARNGAQPTPVYLNAEVQALSEQLDRARQRKQSLRDAGIQTDEVDREILELRRKLREGGQLRAGDALGDGRYLLVKQIGRGGFAVVWEAWDRVEQRWVAIKVLHHHLASDRQRRERFFRGASEMKDLRHRAVVPVLDPRGEAENLCYFVMELVPGGNLQEAVLGNRVAIAHRLELILQVGEALAEAHRKQLVHRDVKPTNILLDGNGNPKLTDFDLVLAHDTTGGTRTGALGTVVYAAPECLDKPQEATARADVFGLGMTAIFCLYGHELSLSTFRDPATTIAKLECSVLVQAVIERAVAWEPERRFPDAATLVDVLRRALGMQEAARDRPELPTPTREPPTHAAKRYPGAAYEGSLEVTIERTIEADFLGERVDAQVVREGGTLVRGGGTRPSRVISLRRSTLDPPADKGAYLVVCHGQEVGMTFDLNYPQSVIGRSLKADILVDDALVSRNHCKIVNIGSAIILCDMGSANGTYVNDEKIDQNVLRDGDRIKLGDCIFKFLFDNAEAVVQYQEIYRSRRQR